MTEVPFDRFLQDLAERDVYPDASDIQNHDVTAIWDQIPAPTREAYLRELGLPLDEGHQPRLDGSNLVFETGNDLGSDEDPQDPMHEALRSLIDEPYDIQEPTHDAISPLAEIPQDPEEPVYAAAQLLEAFDGYEHLPEEPAHDEVPLDEGEMDPMETGMMDGPELIEAETVSLDEGDVDLFAEDVTDAGAAQAVPVEPVEEDDPLAEIEELGSDALEEVEPNESEPREVEVYPVYEPYTYVRISYDEDDHQYLYEVIEPELTDREEKVLDFIQETIIDVIDVGLSQLDEEEAETMLVDLTNDVIQDYSIEVDENTRLRLTYYVVRDFLGFGKLDAIMRDPMIEDVNCDGVGVPIFLYHRKYESMASTVLFDTHEELDSFVIKLAQRSGKHISIADPLLDARLPDGSRLNATLSDEVTTKGSTFTIRKFRDEPFTPPDLIRFGTMSEEMLAYHWMSIQHGASMIVAGGTASGKTTLLNAVMLFIPPQMKIVSIEDTRELNLPHPNWIPGTTRSGFGPRDDKGRQAGEINMFQLLKAALRQRPEYITVGEVRGEEASVLFQAMATGHAAYGTMHADSVTSVIHRLEGEPINIPRPLLEALDIVCIQIQTRIGGKRVRRTKGIVEIVGMDPNTKELLTNEVFRWDPSEDAFDASGISYVLERIQKEENLTRPELEDEIENRTQIIRWMKENEVRDYVDVGKVVQAYYNEPDKLMETIRVDLGLEEGDQTTSGILDDVLEDDEPHETDEAFDAAAEIPIPDDATAIAPLDADTLDQVTTLGTENDDDEDPDQEETPKAAHNEEDPLPEDAEQAIPDVTPQPLDEAHIDDPLTPLERDPEPLESPEVSEATQALDDDPLTLLDGALQPEPTPPTPDQMFNDPTLDGLLDALDQTAGLAPPRPEHAPDEPQEAEET